ncbi:hypothetical protein [Cryptosporangium sp. NPDC051539]|uniref:hypothetical protein n=1 Tax=Cryptosporangium sp. NPDC051539 TaxID=3363962 RepID=UPI00378F3AB6
MKTTADSGRKTAGTLWAGFVVALIGALLGASVLMASPASAATIPAGTVVVPSPNPVLNSAPDRTATATCPADKPRVLGGGVKIVGGGGHVILTREQPVTGTSTDNFSVAAVEDSVGTTANWSLQAIAVCSPAITGLTIVSKAGQPQGPNFGNAISTCPSGTNTISAGGRIDGGGNLVGLNTSIEGGPASSNRTTAAGFSTVGASNWTVIAYTVCAPIGILEASMVKVQVNTGGSTTATCPSGKKVTGGSVWSDSPYVTALDIDANRARVLGQASTPEVIATAVCL